MSLFKLWSSAGKIYKGLELFQSDTPPRQAYIAPPLAFDQVSRIFGIISFSPIGKTGYL